MKRVPALLTGVAVLLLAGSLLLRISNSRGADAKVSQRRILYYVDPMHPAYRSDKPGIAPDCGMQLEPVYDEPAGAPQSALPAGAVSLGLEQQRMVGIRVEVVRSASPMRTLRTTGRVVADENRTFRIHAGFDGWVQTIKDNAPGTPVRKNEVLATLYGPEVRNAENNYLGFVAGVERLKRGMAESDLKNIEDSGRINAEQLRLLGMGEDQIRQLETTHHTDSVVQLVAPENGIVLIRGVSPHQRFDRGTELYRIADLSKVWILADAHGGDAVWQPGARAKVYVPELSRAVTATVASNTPLYDDASRGLKVRLIAENPGTLLRPDMFVDVEFDAPAPRGLSVPADAVVDSGVRKVVYVETQDNIFEPRSVEIGQAFAGRVQITSGLKAGDRVVVEGNFLLDSESRMRAAILPAPSAGETHASVVRASEEFRKSAGQSQDPVCGMKLKPEEVAFTESFQGKPYSFCSETCRKKFLANPASYAKSGAAGMNEDHAVPEHHHD